MPRALPILAAALALAGCGSVPPPTQAPLDAPASAPPAAAAPAGPGAAHALVIQAAACWFGGIWSDAEGAVSADDRRALSDKRCGALAARVLGGDDRARMDTLRLVEPAVVEKLGAEVERLAAGDALDGARKGALQKLLRALAAAQREANDAHVAADAVKRDLKSHEERETLTKDETAAVKPLRAQAAMASLLSLDAGDLSAEAHAMGLLCAMDRVELSRGLPKHLKVYAVAGAHQLLFGVAPPSVPEDVTAKLERGLWLRYLADVARAAGHPVPDKATHPREREPWAFGGMIAGYGDKLRADAGKLDRGAPLGKAVAAIVARLDAEWAEVPAIAASQKAMADREEAARAKKKP